MEVLLKPFALRFLTAFVSYLVGERLVAATFPQGMDYRRGFWDVIRDTFNYEYWPFDRIAVMAIIVGLLLLTDRIGQKRIHIVWLVLIAAFSGGYCYEVVYSLDYLDYSVGGYFGSIMPGTIANFFFFVLFLLALFFPFVLLAVIKLAGLSKFKARLTFGG